jgi:multiple sugar transport system substrate-binding protein
MNKKWFLGLAALSLTIAGCAPVPGEKSGSGDKKPQEVITVVARSGIYYNALSAISPDFEKETGIKVNVQEIGRDAYLQKISTQLLGQGDGMDVVLMLNNYIGQFGAGGQLEPLDDYMKKNNQTMDRFLPASTESVKYKDNIYALPFDVSTMFLIYRKDLIPNPPKTWEEYKEIADKFTKSKNPQSPTEFGIAFQGKRGETQPKDWYQYFWSMGGTFFDKDMKPTLNSDAGVKALSFLVDSFRKDKTMPPDMITYEFPEVLAAFQNEKVAMAIDWNAAYPQLSDASKSPKVSDKFAIAEVPGGVSFTHTWTLAVNKASKSKDAAFKFVNWVTAGNGAKKYALAGGIPAVKSVLQDPEVIQKRPEFPAIEKAIAKAQTEPNLPEWPRIHESISEAISKALAGEKSPKDALDEANTNIKTLMEQRGYYKK